MISVIGIGGEPATGKTTLMRRIIEGLEVSGPGCKVRLGACHFLRFKQRRAFVLGQYPPDVVFAGTDRLSMALQPDALRAVDYIGQAWPGSVVLFEGDRLFNAKFFESIIKRGFRLELFRLTAEPLDLTLRRRRRGDTHGDPYLKGRTTKLDHLAEDFTVERLPSSTPADTASNAARILDEIGRHARFASRLPSQGRRI